MPGPHLVRAGVGSPTMNPPPRGTLCPSFRRARPIPIVAYVPPLSYFLFDCNHSASPRLAALTLTRRLCLIFFSPAVVVVLEHLMSASPCGDDSEELEPLCSQTLPPFVGCSPSGWLCIFGPMFLVCLVRH